MPIDGLKKVRVEVVMNNTSGSKWGESERVISIELGALSWRWGRNLREVTMGVFYGSFLCCSVLYFVKSIKSYFGGMMVNFGFFDGLEMEAFGEAMEVNNG
ncbi:hypothetical protein Tco_0656732 [Tanacetum coccineum]|uniref:Uncharacterized protein n=1 Tax=Tanacetum coccineum TaxID=301880 RepID=A0ABQ4X9K5_9ASTR